MASSAARKREPKPKILSREESRRFFDEAARFWLGMSGEEFLAKYDAGEFDDEPDAPRLMEVVSLMPFAR